MDKKNVYTIQIKTCGYESSCVFVSNNSVTPIESLSVDEISFLSLVLENACSRLKAQLYKDGEGETKD